MYSISPFFSRAFLLFSQNSRYQILLVPTNLGAGVE
jgi:hypothetical protein